MTATLDLWPIGNCQVSALVDRNGRFVWACVPRVDDDPAFSSLLGPAPRATDGVRGFWEIDLEDCVSTEQHYLRSTPILVSRHTDGDGNAIEVVDFCPRFRRNGRIDDARALFDEMLIRRTTAGLVSEDIDPQTGELWGNYPQTYSLVGMINCAVLLSKPWSSIR